MGSADERLPLVAKCVVIPIHAIDRGVSRTDGRVGICNIDTGQPQHCRDLHITASPPVVGIPGRYHEAGKHPRL